MLPQLFKPESEFPKVIGVIFRKREEKIKAIEFELWDVKVLVEPEDDSCEICEKWRKGLLRKVDKQAKMKAELKNINEIFASIEFLQRPEVSKQEYEKIVKEIGNPEIVSTACNWAKLMQYLSGKYGKSIADVKNMSAEAMGVTPLERIVMILILEDIWKYGDELTSEVDEVMMELVIGLGLF